MASTEHSSRTAQARLVQRFRRLDLVVGIPLAWLATRWRRLREATDRCADPNPTATPASLLLIKLSENGSVVLLAPVMAQIAERWPTARCTFLTFEENREVLALVPGMGTARVLAIDPSSPLRFLMTLGSALRELRARPVDVALDLEHFSRFTSLLAFASRARRRVGFHRFALEGLYRGDLFTHRVAYNPYVHTSQAFLGLVDAIDEDPTELPLVKRPVPSAPPALPPFEVSPHAAASIRRKLEAAHAGPIGDARLFVLNPNASERIPIRKWPLERYVELAHRLLETPGHLVVLIGKGEDRHDARALQATLPGSRCLNLCGETDLSELLALLAAGAALITNDSGPAHFGALTRTPTVVLFGPESPTLYAPLGDHHRSLYAGLQCSPCVSAYNHRQTPCNRARCLEAIEVEQVLGALVDLGVVGGRALRRVG